MAHAPVIILVPAAMVGVADDCAKELCPHNCNGERGECKAVGDSQSLANAKRK